MILETDLREWLADRERQRRSESAAIKLADSWHLGPFHRRVEAAMAATEPRTAEAVAAAIETLFEDDSLVTGVIETLVQAMREDPFFVPPFRHINSDVHQGLILYEDDLVSIAAGVGGVAQLAAKKNSPRSATSIGFLGQVSVLKFVKAGGARLSFWEIPPIGADFSAALAGTCVSTGKRDMADGEILVIDGRRRSFVIEHAKANFVLLQAIVKPDQAPLSVEYDSRSHEFVGCSAADDSASRIQMIATLIRKLDHVAAFPVIATFLDNPNFFVRWHIMKELLGLDAEAALPHLERMAVADPHRENRRAAQKVLDTLGAQPLLGKAA